MKLRIIHGVSGLGLVVMLLMAGPHLLAGGTEGANWPEFHGPNRDNVSTEKGLLKQWPEGGPRLIWKFSECGGGFSGVSIAEGKIFTAGDFGPKEMVIALDLDGKVLWKVQNGKSWRGQIPGARTTPTYDNGILYHMSPMGRLAAYQAASGKEVWSVDLKKEFGARYGTWAMSENVRIEGKALLCVPGGTKGAVVALDKTTGKRIWVNTEIEDSAAYCTPLIVTHNGVRQLITLMQKSIVSVDVKTGKLLWKHEHETKHNQNVTKPIYRDGFVFTSSGHGTGGRWFKINPRSDGVTQVWLNKDLDNCHGGVVLLDGSFYGSGCRLFRKGLVCVDMLTGKTTWNDKGLGNVSMTGADGMLYCLDRKGKVSLVEAKAKRCKIVSQFNLPTKSKKLCLAHPVVCGKRLYLRHWNELFAYDINASPGDRSGSK